MMNSDITPFSFDPRTSREVVGHEFALVIEAKARTDADADNFCPPEEGGASYWDRSKNHMRVVVYLEQYRKRLNRNLRKAEIK